MSKVCVIGMWHLGCVTAGCLSLNHEVTCFDFDKKVIDNLEKGTLPIYEPGLEDMLKNSKIKYSTNLKDCVPNADFVYIAYDTPIDDDNKVKLDIIFKTIKKIKPHLNDKTIVLISSQIPVGTTDKISKELNSRVCFIPENLRLGNAIDLFLNPDFIIFGLSFDKKPIEELFSFINCKKIFVTPKEAEMIKHTLNVYLAAMVSFSGEICDICEKKGVDATKVMAAVKADRRVSDLAPIMPGMGFSGGTLDRDVQVLRSSGYTPFLNGIDTANKHRQKYVIRKLMAEGLLYKRVTFLGLTYKVGTSALRDSPTLRILDCLHLKDLNIKVYDPAIKKLEGYDAVKVCDNLDDALDTDVIVIITDWEDFKSINYSNKIVIDTKNMLDPKSYVNITYYGVGVNK